MERVRRRGGWGKRGKVNEWKGKEQIGEGSKGKGN
jgi:hypothetical protein